MIFIVIAIILFILFIYPYIIYPKILCLLPEVKAYYPKQKPNLTFSLVFCAYNEEKNLPKKISNLREIKKLYPDIQILAYSDMSTDRTWNILSSAADILTPIKADKKLGKATGMKKLVELAINDIIIFTDANVLLEPKSIYNLKKYFYNESIGTVSGTLIYTNSNESTTSEVGNTYWKMEEKIKALESKTGSMMGADGSVFAMRKKHYPIVPAHLLDDLISSINPLFRNMRIITANDVIAYEELTTSSADEFRRKKRISCRAFNTHRYLTPKLRKMSKLNKFKYISHKLLRWFGGFILILVFVFFGLGIWVTSGSTFGILYIGLTSLTVAFIFLSENKGANMIKEILKSIFATSIGIIESVQGKTYQTWSPPTSRS